MSAFTFTVFLSAFQLLPTAPFRILGLGGSTVAAGMFLGLLTYASAASAPVTGALADRFGTRTMMIACSAVLTLFSIAYALSRDYRLLLGLAVLHGVFWSGLLSSSAAYVTSVIPENRRAEGIGYWGLATILATAIAPRVGFFLYDRGWSVLCALTAVLHVGMGAIAWSLPDHPGHGGEHEGPFVDWRVMAIAFTLFLYSFGYGGITSFVALYADANGAPRPLFFTVYAIVTLFTRPILGRVGDRLGHKRILVPSLLLIMVAMALLAVGGTRPWLILSAFVFGCGFGTAYPAFVAHVLRRVSPAGRGAAFGAILTAFDTGIGTGSIATGWIVQHVSYRAAFGIAAGVAALSAPYFLWAERRYFAEDASASQSQAAPRTPLASP